MTSEATSGKLPDGFKVRMRELLGDDYEAFIASFDEPRTRGLRLNSAKIEQAELESLLNLQLDPVPWCKNGYHLPAGTSIGGHPAHLAGLFYLQEPSAMAVADVLNQSGPHARSIIDLAASPGGKTTHLADLIGPGGVVVANEISGGRLRALHDNLDLWGVGNVVTISEPLDRLVASGMVFDVAVLDAPCTGEALFRRDTDAIHQWSPAAVEGAARRQQELLALAGRLVGPGGEVVYSTCSFERAENEQQIVDFLLASNRWRIEDAAMALGASSGLQVGSVATERTARLWPHRHRGEGQYVAYLRRLDDDTVVGDTVVGDTVVGDTVVGDTVADHTVVGDGWGGAVSASGRGVSGRSSKRERSNRRRGATSRSPLASADDVRRAWHEFHRQTVVELQANENDLVVTGDRIHRRPPGTGPHGLIAPSLNEARPGLPLGRLRPGRFEPHPGLATSAELGFDPASDRRVSWREDSPQLQAFLRGETVTDHGPDGWVLVCYHRWGIGWARRSRGTLKNLFPGHLRRQAMAHQRRTG